MINKDIVNMTIQHHIKQEIAIKQLKIKSIHKDIIRLKQENRNIGDKVKSLYSNIGTNALKLIDCSETAGYTYNDRVMRDHTTIDYLEKLQMINSRLINKHRSKVKSLRSELQELKKELNVLGDIKGDLK
jgi:predicted RNase H-like nuclease (RuvC/YqgF family)